MWWQILPPSGIIVGLIGSYYVIAPTLHYVMHGRPRIRGLREGSYIDTFLKDTYRRDWTKFGNEYTISGFESLPDDY